MDNNEYNTDFYIDIKGRVPLLKAKNISLPHGFSTRAGGVSTEPHLSTLDLGAGEDINLINENRRRFKESFFSKYATLTFGKQIHGTTVKYIDESNSGDAHECDGFVTDKENILLAVKTADCVPVLLCDETNRVISAVHAGWRGTVGGICENAVSEMIRLGADIENIKAAIGPCIHRECYEVDEPFFKSVGESACADICLKSVYSTDTVGKYTADLVKMNRDILLSCGVLCENIYCAPYCTCCENKNFFSHRAGKGKRGLMMSAIVIPQI